MTIQAHRTLCRHAALTLLSSMGLAFAVAAMPATAFAQSPAGPRPGMEIKKAPSPESTGLTLTDAGKVAAFTAVELKAMPRRTVHVHNEHTKADESYTGVLLADLLAQVGFKVDSSSTHRTMLRNYLQAAGTDGYWVLYSLTEVEPSEHEGEVLVATSVDGHGLGADGQLKLVSTGDKKPQRWVRNLTAITVKSAE